MVFRPNFAPPIGRRRLFKTRLELDETVDNTLHSWYTFPGYRIYSLLLPVPARFMFNMRPYLGDFCQRQTQSRKRHNRMLAFLKAKKYKRARHYLLLPPLSFPPPPSIEKGLHEIFTPIEPRYDLKIRFPSFPSFPLPLQTTEREEME